jgi:hypothetical protein
MREANVEKTSDYVNSALLHLIKTAKDETPRSSSIGGIGEGFESSVSCESSESDHHTF